MMHAGKTASLQAATLDAFNVSSQSKQAERVRYICGLCALAADIRTQPAHNRVHAFRLAGVHHSRRAA